jgi:hypothetical protein
MDTKELFLKKKSTQFYLLVVEPEVRTGPPFNGSNKFAKIDENDTVDLQLSSFGRIGFVKIARMYLKWKVRS